MTIELESAAQLNPTESLVKKPIENRWERHRLIVHLGRTFARRYDIKVLPSGQKGVWACSLDPKVSAEISKYVRGQRDTLEDLSSESFTPIQILYDEQGAQEMSTEEITTLLHHEAGHAKYTDFRLMVEGQKNAKDEGYLPTSFWLTLEGIEDPRVNVLEGEESPAIDRQIRANQAKDLQERISEAPLSDRPLMLQFAYNSFHYWLYGEGITELAETEVGKLGELAKPLIEQYFQATDIEERRILQKQIWDIAKELEKKDLEDEKLRQMAQEQRSQQEQEGETSSGQGQQGQDSGVPSIPGGKDSGNTQKHQEGQERDTESKHGKGQKGFLERLKESIFGQKNKDQESENENKQSSTDEEQSSKEEDQSVSQEKFDLSKLSPEELQELQEGIDNLSPEERKELEKKAKEAIDQAQKEALEEKLQKTLKLEKNKKTGEYEAIPQTASEKMQQQAEADFQQAVQQVEAEEQAEWEQQEAERRQQEGILKQLEAERREKLEMEKAGFDENEREKFLLYQSLEDAMYSHVRNFRQAIEKVIPRRKEPLYEGGYFSGPKFDRRDLVRRAPIGDERFHMRQVEAPIGDPRLFIGLLIDNSGSMSGTKMEQARKTTVFFAKVCKDMGVPFMTAAFGDDAEIIKQFKQDFDNPAERIKPKIIDATDASGGSTNMHAGIEVTIEAMNEQRRKLRDSHGLIFVITDGGANAGLTGDALRSYVEENRGRLTFKAFGLSGSDYERDSIQSYLNNYFGDSNCAYPEGFDDLPDEAFRVLRVNLMQFQRYLG